MSRVRFDSSSSSSSSDSEEASGDDFIINPDEFTSQLRQSPLELRLSEDFEECNKMNPKEIKCTKLDKYNWDVLLIPQEGTNLKKAFDSFKISNPSYKHEGIILRVVFHEDYPFEIPFMYIKEPDIYGTSVFHSYLCHGVFGERFWSPLKRINSMIQSITTHLNQCTIKTITLKVNTYQDARDKANWLFNIPSQKHWGYPGWVKDLNTFKKFVKD